MRLRTGIGVIVLLTGLSCASGAEVFHMKDGSRFEGTVVGVKADDLDVSVSGKTLLIRKDTIGWIDYEPEWDGKTMRRGEKIVKAGLGAAIPTGAQDFNHIAKTGVASEIEAVVQLTDSLGIGARFDDQAFTVAYPSDYVSRSKSEVDASTLVLEGRYVFLPKKTVSPFVVVGLGVDAYSEHFEKTPSPGSTWADTGTRETREVEGVTSGAAVEAGAGVQFLLSRRYLAELAARWHYAGVDGDKFGFTQAQSVTLLASVGWRF